MQKKCNILNVIKCMLGKTKREIISALLVVVMLFTICSAYTTEAFAEAGVTQSIINATPNGLDFSEQPDQSINITNSYPSEEESYLMVDKLYSYSTAEMNVLQQNKSSNSAEAIIGLIKDNDNKVIFSQKASERIKTVLDNLDLTGDILNDAAHPIIKSTANGLVFSKEGNTLKLSNPQPGNVKEESYIKLGALANAATIDMEVSAQVKSASYTANACIDIRTADGLNRLIIVQRAAGTYTIEVFQGGQSKGTTTLAGSGISTPYTMRVRLADGILNFYRVKDGVESSCGTFDVKPYFDLTKASVLNSFSAFCGARLNTGESVSISKAEQYQETEESCYADIYKNGAKVYTKSFSVFGENPPYSVRLKVNGNTLNISRFKDNKETYIATIDIKDYFNFLDNNTVEEFSVYEGARLGAGESISVSKLTNTAESPEALPDKITFNKLVDGTLHCYDSNIELQKLNGSEPVMNITTPGNTVTTGSSIEFTNEQADTQESYVNLGPLFAYAGQDMDVELQNTVTGQAIMMFYKDDNNKIIISQQGADSATDEYTYTVYKNGMVVNKTTVSNTAVNGPYTMRVRTNGRYIVLWRMVNGTLSYFSPRLQISDWFDLRDPAVLDSFSVYVGAKLAPGESIKISGASQYLTNGVGQADPRFFHYENGEPMIENDITWLTLSSRCDTIASTHTGVFSYNLKTYELKLLGVITFDKGDGLKRPLHSCDVLYDRNAGNWKISATSFDEDHKPYGGVVAVDPRIGDVNHITDVLVSPILPDGEDASIIWDEAANKWRAAWVASVSGGFALRMAEADNYAGPYTVIKSNTAVSETGALIQKMGGKYYVFTGRGTSGEMWVYNYPDLSLIGRLNVPEGPVANNIWPVILPYINANGGTSYQMMTFDRYMGWGGDHSYGKIYIFEGDRTNSLWDYAKPVTEVSVQPVSVTTTVGTAPVLPVAVTVTYSDNTAKSAAVQWEEIAPEKYAQAGSFNVTGTVAGTAMPATAAVTVTDEGTQPEEPTIVSVQPVSVTTTVGTAPVLPVAVTVTYSDNTAKSAAVQWEEIAPEKYAQAGSFNVTGTVAGTAMPATAAVTVTDEGTQPEEPAIVSIQPVYVSTTAGTAPVLPAAVTAIYSDNTTTGAAVQWAAISPSQYAQAGSFNVSGSVENTNIPAMAFVTVNAVPVTPPGVSSGTSSGTTSPAAPSQVTKPAAVDRETVKVEAKADKDGKVTVSIKGDDIKTAVNNANNGTVSVEVKVDEKAREVKVSIPAQPIVASDKQINNIRIDTGLATVNINPDLLKNNNVTQTADLQLTVTRADSSAEPAAVRSVIGNSEVYDFSLKINGTKISTFENKEVSVDVAYTLKPGQDPNKVIVYDISDSGKLEIVKNSWYDAGTGKVHFKPEQFNKYAVFYNDVTFSDLSKAAWARSSIEALAARGIVAGRGDNMFMPGDSITRAEFLAMLLNAFDLTDEKADCTFKDVNDGKWYYNAIATAQKLGIVRGKTDGTFGINDAITRQDMAVMVYKVSELLKVEMKETNSQTQFKDSAKISAYAVNAISAMQKSGIINGVGNDNFAPKNNATRAQAAVIIYQVFNLAE